MLRKEEEAYNFGFALAKHPGGLQNARDQLLYEGRLPGALQAT